MMDKTLAEIKAACEGHTPGEWGFARAELLYDVGDITVHVVRGGSADGVCVAQVRDNGIGRKARISNARLIAHAPDLLALCEQQQQEIAKLQERIDKGKELLMRSNARFARDAETIDGLRAEIASRRIEAACTPPPAAPKEDTP